MLSVTLKNAVLKKQEDSEIKVEPPITLKLSGKLRNITL